MNFINLPNEIIENILVLTETYKDYLNLSMTCKLFHQIAFSRHILDTHLSRKLNKHYCDADNEFNWHLFNEGVDQCSLCARCAINRVNRRTSFSSISSNNLSSRRGSADTTISNISSISEEQADETDKIKCMIHSVSPAAASMLAYLL